MALKTKVKKEFTVLPYIESTGTQYVDTGISLTDNAEIIVNDTKVTLSPIKKFVQADFNSGTFYNCTKTLLSNQQNSSDGFTLVGRRSQSYSATVYTNQYVCWAYKYDFTNCKTVNYYARKNANHGVSWVYVLKDLNSTASQGSTNFLAEKWVHYNDLSTSWTKYTLDVSNISGEAYIVFVGGYIDNTGNTTSSTSYCDIQFELANVTYKLFEDITKIYTCKILKNDVLVMDFIPVLESGNTPCLYDKITKEFFYNQGTGEFHYAKPVDLPEGYTQVSYIQSSGTQYIDTKFIPDNNTHINIRFQFLSAVSKTNAIYGARTAWANAMSTFEMTTSGGMVFGYGTKYVTLTPANLLEATDYVMDMNIASVNGNGSAITANTFTAPCSAFLFAYNNNGSVASNATGRLYSCKIYDADTLVRDFVPCINMSDVAGLYDLVENKFYANAGTGTFTTGELITDKPQTLFIEKWVNPKEIYVKAEKEIRTLEYLESTGTQWIDTGLYANQNTRIVCDFQFTNISTTQYLFCARGAGGSYTNRFGLLLHSSGYFRSDYNSANLNLPTTLNLANRHVVDFNKNVCTVGVETVTHTTSTFAGEYHINLFAGNTGGNASELANVRIYSCQIYDNDILVRDYIPALDENDTPCLFDKVSGEFYYNAGTGEFVAGDLTAITNHIAWHKPDQMFVKHTEKLIALDYIESTGTQFIDTEFIPDSNTRVVMDFDLTTVTSEGWAALFATRTDNSKNAFGIYSNSAFTSVYDTFGTLYLQPKVSLKGRHVIDKNKNVTMLDDAVINTFGTSTFVGDASLRLLWESSATPQYDYPFIGKLYSCKIYDNDTLIRDYIPVLDSNNTPCLYDKVHGVFYYNQGTGDFVAGEQNGIVTNSYWKEIDMEGTPKYEQLVNYTMLYDYGDECTDVTGGWQVKGWRNYSNATAKAPTITKGSKQISASIASSSTYVSGVLEVVNKIDMTPYSKISLTYSASGATEKAGYDDITFYLADSSQSYYASSPYFLYELLKISWDGLQSKTVNTTTVNFDIASVTNVAEIIIGMLTYQATLKVNVDLLYFTKQDNITTLASKANISATDIATILASSSTLLSNKDAVDFMIAQCTGDFMASAIQNSTFMTALVSSPYKEKIYANEHWAKFLAMVA